MRAIDADKIPWTDLADGRAPSPVLVTFADKVNKMPTIESQRTGRWIKHIDDLFPAESTIECSECHHEQPLTIDDNYCPNCGARMEDE